MRKTKSLIITTGNFPYGGCTANFVRVFAKGLMEHQVQVEVIQLKGNEMDFMAVNDPNLKSPDYRSFLFRVQPKSFLLKLVQFLSIVGVFPWYLIFKILAGRFRIVYLYGVEYPYLTIPYLIICKLLNRKCIRIITDYYSAKSVASTWWRKPKWHLYNLEFRYIDRYFDGLIVLSDILKDKLIKSKVRPNKIIRTLHFIDLNDFQLNSSIETKLLSEYSIGYIGTISNSNGINVLLKAFELLSREMKNIKLFIIGDLNYESGIAEKIEQLMHVSKLSIIAPGFQNPENIKRYYQTCDILINPRISSLSADAGFPTKVGEYMSTGKPVIVTAVGFFKDPKFQDETGVVVIKPDSPETMAEAIREVIINYRHYHRESSKNVNWVKSNLDYYHNSKIVLDFITK